MIYEPIQKDGKTTDLEKTGDSSSDIETHATLSNKVDEIVKLIEKLNSDLDGKTEIENIEAYVTDVNTIILYYVSFLRNVMDNRFDFIKEIAKFKGLLAHDLEKPARTLYGMATVLDGLNDEDAVKTLKALLPRIKEQTAKLRGSLDIIDSINKASVLNETPRISLKSLVRLLGMEYVDGMYLLQKGVIVGTQKFHIPVEIKNKVTNSEESLTVEEFFTLSTMLTNLTKEKCNNARVEITEDEKYRYITLYDDIGNTWPSAVEKSFQSKYPFGYANPTQALETSENGLGMVFLLAGQRHRVSGAPTSQQFAEYVNVEEGGMKYIRVKFAK